MEARVKERAAKNGLAIRFVKIYNCRMTEKISLGRKIFFLYPSAIIQNHIVTELAQEEFEVYVVKDEKKLKRVLKNYPDSIVIANISDGMKEKEWEDWIRGVMGSAETKGVDIGILSYDTNEAVMRKYAEHYRVRCGYIVMKSDTNAVIKQLVTILHSNNAKGRRKYIRVLTDKETNVTVNLPINGTYVTGSIKDVSVVGFSCCFSDDPDLTKNSLFTDIQLRLQTSLLKAEGIVFGSRMETGLKNYVILFTQRMDPNVRARIRNYIQSNLQSKMDEELK